MLVEWQVYLISFNYLSILDFTLSLNHNHHVINSVVMIKSCLYHNSYPLDFEAGAANEFLSLIIVFFSSIN